MEWTSLNWAELDRLRDGFLNGGAAKGPYWTEEALEAYDRTYAQRIGWKWEAVLREATLRGFTLPEGDLLDWGCGSGIAGRKVLQAFGRPRNGGLLLWDHSGEASGFAGARARATFEGLSVSEATVGYLQSEPSIGTLVISHVLNELSAEALAGLKALIRRSQAVLWCEVGTREVSRQLSGLHEEFRREFRLVAPCPHQAACPILAPQNERHWCHMFAPPPSDIFSNPDWVKFGQRAGIDLRSLPYSFLILDRNERPAADPKLGRVIGRPEAFKPYTRFLNCGADGLNELMVQKRDDPRLIKELDRTKEPLVYRWSREGNKVVGGESLAWLSEPKDASGSEPPA